MKTVNGSIGGKDVRKDIQETTHFQSMTKMLQKLCMSSNNVRKINDALVIINNIEYEKWEKNTNFRYNNKKIINEIHEKTLAKIND